MLKRLFTVFAVTVCLVTSLAASAAATDTIAIIPDPPALKAKSHILLDFNSNELLASHNAYEQVEPASLTKIMTMYVINRELSGGNLKLTDMVRISEKAWRAEGSRMFIEVDTEVSVSDLIHGIIVQSGNDASIALAEYIAGSEKGFVDLMNSYSQALGLHKSHFMNVTGMPHPEHYTTAHDTALLAKAVVEEFPPELFAIYSQKWFTYNGIKQPNRNRLLWRDPSVDGLKTGSTDSAGFCLVSTALKNNMRLISVVMGADSDNARAEQSQRLLSYGFRFFETHHLYSQGDTLNETRIWMGSSTQLPLGVSENIYLTIPQGQYKNLEASLNMNEVIRAPANKGDILGNLVIKLNDEIVLETPLVALDSIPKGSAWRRFSDYVSMKASGVFGSKSS